MEKGLSEISLALDSIWDQTDNLNATLISKQKRLSRIQRALVHINEDWKKFPEASELTTQRRRQFMNQMIINTSGVIDKIKGKLFQREDLIEFTKGLIQEQLSLNQNLYEKARAKALPTYTQIRMSPSSPARLVRSVIRYDEKLAALKAVKKSGRRLIAALADTKDQVADLNSCLDDIGVALAKLEDRSDREEDLYDVLFLIRCIPSLFNKFIEDIEISLRFINQTLITMISLSELVGDEKMAKGSIRKLEKYTTQFRYWLSEDLSETRKTMKDTERRLRCKDSPLKFILRETKLAHLRGIESLYEGGVAEGEF